MIALVRKTFSSAAFRAELENFAALVATIFFVAATCTLIAAVAPTPGI